MPDLTEINIEVLDTLFEEDPEAFEKWAARRDDVEVEVL